MSGIYTAQERAFKIIRDINKQRKIVQDIIHGDTVTALNKLNSFILDELEERKLLQDELLRSELKYRNLLESGMDGVSVAIDGKYVFVNRAFAEMLGCKDPSELVGKGYKQFVTPESYETLNQIASMRANGDDSPKRYELKIVDNEGSILEVEALSSVISYEGKRAVLDLTRDITDYKRVLLELERSEAEKKAILDAFPYSLSYKDSDFRFIWVNKVIADSVGLAEDDVMGRICFEVSFNRSEKCEDCFFENAIETGEMISGKQTFANGKVMDVIVVPIRDENGQVTSAIEISRETGE